MAVVIDGTSGVTTPAETVSGTGVVKGDQAQINKYIADCLAVKAKYPKP